MGTYEKMLTEAHNIAIGSPLGGSFIQAFPLPL